MRIKRIVMMAVGLWLAVSGSGEAWGQCGSSEPTPPKDCGEYQWPLVSDPCPEVQIKQKHDHTPLARYRKKGWDTVVTCLNQQLVLSCTPYIPVERFNGCYYVDEIPFNPPDTTFWMNGQGLQQDITSDDRFAPTTVSIAYPFYFFGIRKNYFRLGDNGIVTFTTGFGQDGTSTPLGCPYSFSSGIPWTTSNCPTYGGNCFNRMHDAIYGVYEDTYTGSGGSYMSGNQGIYYGVVDEAPCRKIICSWNQIPVYNDNSKRESYQIVCYEGSNIVEVHVKQRTCCPSTSQGIIGIQNATGVAQQKGTDPDAPNWYVQNGTPAAFFPVGYNPFQSSMQNTAFRFTPRGLTPSLQYEWIRVFDDGRPSQVLTQNPNDTNGYFSPMNRTSATCDNLTLAYVAPTEPSKYVFHLKFKNAEGTWYNLYDTIFIGVDTLNYLDIHQLPATSHPLPATDICLNDTARMRVDIHEISEIMREQWTIFRISGGDTIALDTLVGVTDTVPHSNYLTVGPMNNIAIFRLQGNDTVCLDTTLFSKEDYDDMGDSLRVRAVYLYSALLPPTGLVANKIDSIYMVVSVDYLSGCRNYDTMLVRIFPNFDITTEARICKGESYTWSANDEKYTQSTDPQLTMEHLASQPGCDSVVRLWLTVYDVSLTIDHISDCKPIRWQNGKVYSSTNTATAATDTVVLQNVAGCDSVVRLDFVLHPLTAKLRSNVDHFTIDNLNAELYDISTGGNGRVWHFPTGVDQTGPTAYYTIPSEMDGAEIVMVESSEYGCVDTAKIYIPLNKEYFWMPNAFTPDNPAGNNLFGSVSLKTVQQEMLIFNRRGEMVFRCEGVDCTWDGRDLDGNPCIQGAYVYIIRYTNEFEPKDTKVIKGTVTLIR